MNCIALLIVISWFVFVGYIISSFSGLFTVQGDMLVYDNKFVFLIILFWMVVFYIPSVKVSRTLFDSFVDKNSTKKASKKYHFCDTIVVLFSYFLILLVLIPVAQIQASDYLKRESFFASTYLSSVQSQQEGYFQMYQSFSEKPNPLREIPVRTKKYTYSTSLTEDAVFISGIPNEDIKDKVDAYIVGVFSPDPNGEDNGDDESNEIQFKSIICHGKNLSDPLPKPRLYYGKLECGGKTTEFKFDYQK
ncbi:type IV pilin-like G/H family protein [Spirulina subsalsa]|uniref:type IV pilin-like G/H family protein n=1 Tax=Spirulina subsalsa TaxID=54311 RepID=UPI00031D4B9E|nr:type IV pilin-like G/H family protein [Spirulina subsalsa]